MDDIPKEYVAGYLDGLQPVKLEVNETDNSRIGYRLRTSLLFDTHTDHMRGFLDELLRDQHIRYHVASRGDQYKRLRANSYSATIELLDEYEDLLIREAPLLEYLKKHRGESNTIRSKQEFANHVATMENLFPSRKRGESVKYTSEFFEEQWDVTATPFDLESNPEARDLSHAYVAGLLDGAGRITIGISQTEDYEVGFSFSPRVEFTLTDCPPELDESLTAYFDSLGLSYGKNTRGATTTYSIQRISEVEQLLEAMGGELIRHFYTANEFYSDIIPRVKEGEHTDEEGFYQLVQNAERAIAQSGRLRHQNDSVKYTSEFFEEELDLTVTATAD